MTNEMVGIAGTIGLTFLLFGLRNIILPSHHPSHLPLGRANKERRVTPTAHHEDHELNMKTVGDDAWLLWMPDVEIEPRAGRAEGRGEGNEPRGERRKASTRDERFEDRTLGGEIR